VADRSVILDACAAENATIICGISTSPRNYLNWNSSPRTSPITQAAVDGSRTRSALGMGYARRVIQADGADIEAATA
jgi:hypothetical protein